MAEKAKKSRIFLHIWDFFCTFARKTCNNMKRDYSKWCSVALAFGAWYNATKYALEAFSDALRMEVKPYGVDVVIIEPGAIRTDWGICPRIINSWLDNNLPQLEGKTIIPFATSGSSGIEEAEAYLKKTYPTLNWQKGLLLNKWK